ncbi:alpha/beta hydrolase [Streptomyces sp. 8K308]|uniref:alpha/beta fold hydrolase n=1 Tax=Streptomyces sp. 8K308 TaxID=2530388 RepID=UPI001FB61EA9|nr:alpha/beta hydrolase [Streptomyces sp. 8K308]
MPDRVQWSTVVSTGGARLHTEVHGPEDRPTVVLVHGWACDTGFWRPLRERLLPEHRVVVYDQRGHGRTPATPGACSPEALADDLCAVLTATVPSGARAVVAGHSMGAMTVVAAAARPELRDLAAATLLCSTGVDRLTAASTVFPLPPGRARGRAQRLLLTTRLPYGPVTPLSRQLVRYVTMGRAATAEQRRTVARMVSCCPRLARAEWGGMLADLDLSPLLPRLDLPTTVVHGTVDRLTPLAHARRTAGRLPRLVELVELPGIGHMAPFEAPDRVMQPLIALVKEHLL